jgi:hypothetical protein
MEGSWFDAGRGALFDWERRADIRRARWELDLRE